MTLEELTERVHQLEATVAELTESFQAVSHSAPSKLREPTFRVVDGTDWNPGSGQGVYVYLGGAWTKL